MTPSVLLAKMDSKRNISSKVKKKIIVIRSHRKVGKLWKRTTNVPFPALSTSLCLHREHFPCSSKLHHCSIWKSKIETKFKVKKPRMKRRPPFKSEAALLCAAKIKNDIKQQRAAQFYSWHGSTLTIFFPFFHWWWPWERTKCSTWLIEEEIRQKTMKNQSGCKSSPKLVFLSSCSFSLVLLGQFLRENSKMPSFWKEF